MFFLSYVNELCISFSQFSRSVTSDSLEAHGLQHARPPCPCIYLRLVCLRLRTNLTNQSVLFNKPVCFTHANVLLSYVNETIFAWKPTFLQDSCQSFMAQDNSPCANLISKCMLWVTGMVPGSEF